MSSPLTSAAAKQATTKIQNHLFLFGAWLIAEGEEKKDIERRMIAAYEEIGKR